MHRNKMVNPREITSQSVELREPLQRFLPEKKLVLAAHFSDKEWVAKLAYLCDIFNLLNDLYLSLQGKMATVFKLADKVAEKENKLLEITNDGRKSIWKIKC